MRKNCDSWAGTLLDNVVAKDCDIEGLIIFTVISIYIYFYSLINAFFLQMSKQTCGINDYSFSPLVIIFHGSVSMR